MKIKALTTILFVLISLVGLAQKVEINKVNLCKKWNLEKYEFFWIDYDPENNEKNDYIRFNTSNKYESVDEGKFGTGGWKLQKEDKETYIVMSSDEGELRLLVDELDKDKLVVVVDHEELFDLKIHFKAQ